MNTKPTSLSQYVPIEVSPTRVARLWAVVSARIGTHPFQQRRYSLAVVAAVGLSLGAGGGFWVAARQWHGASVSFGATLQTTGDRLFVDLDGGDQLELAANTRVQVLPGDIRNAAIRLQQGTVVCEVASHGKRHFSVLVADLEIQDTGTRFSVSRDAESGQVEVTVERGSVLIVGPAGAQSGRSITAGERWVRDRGRALSPTQPPPQTSSPSLTPRLPTAPPADANVDVAPVITKSKTFDAEPTHDSTALTPDTPTSQALFDQGNVARRAGNAAAAARAYQMLLAHYPKDSRTGLAALELGRLRMGPLADVPGAVHAFELALARAPSAGFREDALAHLIAAHADLGEIAKCRSLREAYLKDYPHGVHVALVERQCSGK